MLLVRYMEHGVDRIPELADEDKEGTVGDVLNGRDRVHLDATYKSELYDDFLEDLKEQAADNGTPVLAVSLSYFLQVLRKNYKVFDLSCVLISSDLP